MSCFDEFEIRWIGRGEAQIGLVFLFWEPLGESFCFSHWRRFGFHMLPCSLAFLTSSDRESSMSVRCHSDRRNLGSSCLRLVRKVRPVHQTWLIKLILSWRLGPRDHLSWPSDWMVLGNFIEKVSSSWPLTILAHSKRRKRARAIYVYLEPNSDQVSEYGKITGAANASWFRIGLQNL